MLRIFLIVGFLLYSVLVYGFFPNKKTESDFHKNFNIAKQHLSQREIDKALPYLLYLNKNYPNNANLKYLIGVCYAEKAIVNPKTLELLEEASLKASLEYNPNSLEEERVPIYVYYYLSIALSQNKKCEEAEKYREKFIEVYPHKDKYYLDESLRWLGICEAMKEVPNEIELPKFPDFKPYSSVNRVPKKVVQFAPKEEQVTPNIESTETTKARQKENEPKSILTRKIEYSTEFPLYGVQLGAFKEVVPVSRFKEMKNVDAFMDKKGLIRYVVGHFSIYSQAESLLKFIKSKGYEDAFVVNVNNEKKYSDEVVSVNNINIRARSSKKLEYRIQIGAFKEKISDASAELYMRIEGIKEHREDSLTILTVGSFKTYAEAKAYSEGIIDAGIQDAFVIALTNGKKVSLQQVNGF